MLSNEYVLCTHAHNYVETHKHTHVRIRAHLQVGALMVVDADELAAPSPPPKASAPFQTTCVHADTRAHLQIGVLMVVDADQLVARLRCQVAHQGGLAAGGGALQQDGVLPAAAAHAHVNTRALKNTNT